MSTLDEQTLTRMLLESGWLTGGVVESAVQTPSSYTAFTSKLYDLRLTYSADSSGKRPERALMKVTEAPMFRAGRAESSFYAFANQHRKQQPDALVEIYGNLLDDEAQLAVLLMKDMAGPFVGSEWPVPFQHRDCVRVVQALAGVHAHWWGDVRVDAERAARVAGREADDLRIRSSAQSLIDRLGDALSPVRRALIERLADVYPLLHESRLAESGRQTVVHGDAHLWNFLIPEDESRASLLIDWQLWGVDFGAADLAYMMALHWFPERRQRFEKNIVRSYAEALCSHGIDCEFEDIWTDYRFMVAGLLTRVAVYSTVIPAGIWWPHLERAFLAFEDLDCDRLISR